MSRGFFGAWGAELDDDTFAQALAALGTARAATGDLNDPPGILTDLASRLRQERQPVLPWSLARIESGGYLRHRAKAYASAWSYFIGALGRDRYFPKLRLALQVRKDDPVFYRLPWLVGELTRQAVGISGVFVDDVPAGKPYRWTWPLRVGCLPTARGMELRQELSSSDAVKRGFAQMMVLDSAHRECDVLLSCESVRETIRACVGSDESLRAQAVLVIDRYPQALDAAIPLLAGLQAHLRAGAVAIAPVAKRTRAVWFTKLLYNLTHSLPLDAALVGAALRDLKLSAPEVNGQPPLLFSSRAFLDATRLEERLRSFAADLAAQPARARVMVSANVAYRLDLGPKAKPGMLPASDIGATIRDHLDRGRMRFDREEDEATVYAALAAGPVEREPPAPRYLRAQIDSLEAEERKPADKVLVTGARYAVSVSIGPADENWLLPRSRTTMIEPPFPLGVERQVLTVVLAEPYHLREPLVETLELPRTGESKPVDFLVTIGTNPRFDARIIVLHRNRVLQTGLLGSRVVATPGAARAHDAITYDVEAVVRRRFSGLSGRTQFDCALVANHSNDGARRVTAITPGAARIQDVEGDLDAGTRAIAARLSALSDAMDAVKQPLLKEATLVTGLRDLARHGSLVFKYLTGNVLPEGWDTAPGRHIQVISAHPDAYLPLEFAYDKLSPDPAKPAQLCPKAGPALEAGKCLDCLKTDEDWRAHVCPLRFWGMQHVIERHAFDKKLAKELGADRYALQEEPVEGRSRLDLPGTALFAASARAEAVEAGLIGRVFTALKSVAKPKAIDAADWEKWRENVNELHPSFLLLVPHTYSDAAGIPVMEIGKGKDLPSDQLDGKYVRTDGATPVVLLLGCDTAVLDKLYASFVGQFRLGGAAIVVCTLSTVLGRHIGRICELLLAELAVKKDGRSLGELLLRVRQQALAAGIATGMSIVGFGDADWRI